MMGYGIQFLGKGDLIHYRIKGVVYDATGDYFDLKLINHLKDCPEVNIRIGYCRSDEANFIVSKTNNQRYHLTSSSSKYIEGMSRTVADGLRKVLREVCKHGKNEGPKRISIF